MHCRNVPACGHQAPIALVVPIMLCGKDASSDELRERARCTECGRKGATIQLPSSGPSWWGMCLPFPDEEI